MVPALVLCALSLLTTNSFAQTWTGTNSTDWADAANWDTGVPGLGGVVTINDVVNDTDLNADSNFLSGVTITGNTLTVGAAAVLYSDNVSITGTGNLTLYGNIDAGSGSFTTSVSMDSSGTFTSFGTINGDLLISAGTTNFNDPGAVFGGVIGYTTITGGVLNINTTDFVSDILVSGGSLQYNPTSSRVHTSDVGLDGGAVTYNGVGNNAQHIADLYVFDASTINIAAGGVGNSGFLVDGDLFGSENLTVNSITAGVGLVLRGNTSSYDGTLTVTGNANSGQGVGSGLALGDVGTGLSSATFAVNGTLELGDSLTSMGWANNGAVSGTTAGIGALNGSGVVVGNMRNAASTRTLSVDTHHADGNFSGSIVDGFQNTLSFIKEDTGTQILSGTNNYTGTTTVNAGTLQFGTTGSLYNGNVASWTAANINVKSGATLALNADSNGTNGFTKGDINTLLSNISVANTPNEGLQSGATIAFDTSTDGTGTFTFNSDIADSTGASGGAIGVTKLGTGALVLSGNNTYTGETTVTEGTLRVGSNNALGSTVGGTTVLDGARLRLDNVNIGNEALTINGTGTNSSNGALANIGTSSYAGQITAATNATINAGGGNLTLSGGLVKDGTTLTLTGGGNIFINSEISGASANSDLIVDGVTVDLNNANTYNGPTYIRSTVTDTGIINANVFGALPNANDEATRSRVIMDDSGVGSSQLNLFADQRIASLTGATSSLVDLNGNTLTIGQNGAPDATFAGVISGSGGLTKRQDNVQILSGQNTYTGTTTIYNGTLRAGAGANGQAFGNNSAVIIDDFGNATLELNDTNQTIGSLEGNGNVRLGSGTLTTGGDDSSTTYSGKISGTGNLIKTGSGEFTLDNQNTYIGATNINAGTLVVTQDGALGTTFTGTTVASGASLSLFAVNYATAEDLTITGTGVSGSGALSNVGSSTYAGQITVLNGASISAGGGDLTLTGGIVKDGTTLTLNGGGNIFINSEISGASANSDLIVDGVTVDLNNANTYNGPTYIRSTVTDTGIINANVFGALPNPTDQATRSRVIMDDSGTGSSQLNLFAEQRIASLTGAASSLVYLDVNTLTIGQNGAPDATFAGVISGSGGLTKRNQNTQILSGENTYTGATTIFNGTLRAAGAGTNGQAFGANSAVTLDDNAGAILDLNSTNQTIGSLAGGGALGGNVTLGSGTLTTGGDDSSTTYGGVISGLGGGLTKEGLGTFTLTGINTYTGATTINAGTLQLDGSTAAGSTVAVNTNGTLSGNGTVNGNATLTGNGIINFGATGNIAGTLGVTGGNWNGQGSVTGVVTSSSGIFTIGAGANLTATGGLNVTGGTIAAADASSTITGSINYTSNSYSTFQGVIAGGASTVTVNNELLNSTGGLELTGANTYGGLTTVTSGVLVVSGTTATIGVNSDAIVSNTGTLRLTGDASIGQNVQITGSGSQNFGPTPLGAINAFGSTTSTVSGLITLLGNASIVAEGGSTLDLDGGIVKDGTTLTLTGGGKININGEISGVSANSDLIVDGVTVNEYVANTYNGPTFIRSTAVFGEGILNTRAADALPTLNGRTALTMDDSGLGGSQLNLRDGFNQSIASLTGAVSSLVDLNGNTLTIGTASGSTNFAGVISGLGGLVKDGTSTQVLSNSNNYDGATSVNAGILQVDSNKGLGSNVTGTTVANGATLALNGVNYSTAEALTINGAGYLGGGALANIGTSTYAGAITVATNATINAGGGTLTLTGGIDKDGTTLTLTGGGKINIETVGISGASANSDLIVDGVTVNEYVANTYNGPTFIRSTAVFGEGILNTRAADALPTLNGRTALTMDDSGLGGSQLNLRDGFNQSIASLTGAVSSLVDLNGNTLTIGTASGSTNFAGVISGLGGLVKDGTSTQVLSNSNNYDGATSVNAGILQVDSNKGLGSNVTGTTVANGATLALNGVNYSTAEALTINGAGYLGGGALANIGTSTYAGAITVATNATINAGGGTLTLTGGIDKDGTTLTLTGGGTININTVGISGVSANSDLIVDSVTVNLNTANTYNGPTFIRSTALAGSGILNTNAADALPTANGRTVLTMDDSGLGSSQLNLIGGFNQSIASLTGSASSLVNLNSNTLTIGTASGTTTFAGVISGSGGITKDDASTQILSGLNTYTGSTTVNAGVLRAGVAVQAFGNGSAVTMANVAGATLDLNNFNQTIGSLAGGGALGGNVTLGTAALTTGGNNTSTTYAGVISGTGADALIKNGSGTFTLSGTNTYTGTTQINAGVLQAGAAAGGQAFGNLSAVTLNNALGATLDLNNFDQTIGSLAGGGGASGGNVSLGDATLTTGGLNTSTTFAGVISGLGGGLTKNGNGTFSLSGANTYTGLTTINSGTLALTTAGGRLSPSSSLLINGGQLTFVDFETVSGFTQNAGIINFDVDHPGGALVDCQLNPGVDNDVLYVNGTSTLGGTVNVIKQGVEFQRGESALLIDSNNIIGTPDFFTHDYTNRMFLVVDSVTTDNVTLLGTGVAGQNGNLANIAGLNANQIAIANAINTNIAGNGNILDTTVEMDQIALFALGDCETAPGAGLDILSPEPYAGFSDYGVQTIKSYTMTALSMPGYSRDGTARSVRIPVGNSSSPMMMSSNEGVTSVFAGFSQYSTGTDSSINGADYDISSNGGILGVRHEVNRLTLGGFVAVDEGDINSITLNSDVEAFLLGAFASYVIKPEMNLVVTGGLTYGSYKFDGTRQSLGLVTFDDVGSDVLDLHLGIEGDAYSAGKLRVTPFAGLHYISSSTDGFTETGLGALTVAAHDYDAFFSEIGVKAEYQYDEKTSLNANISYTRNLSGSDKNIGASLGGTPFAVSSPGLGDDILTIGLGAQYQVTKDVRLGINYRAEFTTDAEPASGLSIGGSYSF